MPPRAASRTDQHEQQLEPQLCDFIDRVVIPILLHRYVSPVHPTENDAPDLVRLAA